MRIRVRHETEYTFRRPVFLEPHTFRMIPRTDPSQTLLEYGSSFDPKPAGVSSGTGLCGNREETVWFDGLTRHLRADVSFEVETLRSNPYDFIISAPWAAEVPARIPDLQRPAFVPFLETGALPPAVLGYGEDILREEGRETMAFLDALNRSIRERFDYVVREVGDPYSPAELLGRGKGSCRDFALFFMAVCRSQGFPARFVSGYHEGDPEAEENHLHAWAEVYLPGGGWRGFDPTHALLAADRHVAVAAGPSHLEAAPVTGSYRGDGAESSLKTSISVQKMESSRAP